MSAKSNQYFPASPTETLVTVSRLAAIQRAQGDAMVFGATCPGRGQNGLVDCILEVDGLRTPYVYLKFHVHLKSGTTSVVGDHHMTFYEQNGPAEVGYNLFRKNLVITSEADYIHVHRVSYGIGGTNPQLQVNNPTKLFLRIQISTKNGTEPENVFKNLIIGGFSGYDRSAPGENVPFRLKQNGGYVDYFSYSEWPA